MDFTPSISGLTLGTVQLGLNFGIANIEEKPNEEKSFKIMGTAFSSGVNYLDTATNYSDSGNIIGKYLKSSGKKRSEMVNVTKFKLGSINRSEALSALIRSFEPALKNLNTGYIDIIMLHDAGEYKVFQKEIKGGFEQLLARGLLRAEGQSERGREIHSCHTGFGFRDEYFDCKAHSNLCEKPELRNLW